MENKWMMYSITGLLLFGMGLSILGEADMVDCFIPITSATRSARHAPISGRDSLVDGR